MLFVITGCRGKYLGQRVKVWEWMSFFGQVPDAFLVTGVYNAGAAVAFLEANAFNGMRIGHRWRKELASSNIP